MYIDQNNSVHQAHAPDEHNRLYLINSDTVVAFDTQERALSNGLMEIGDI